MYTFQDTKLTVPTNSAQTLSLNNGPTTKQSVLTLFIFFPSSPLFIAMLNMLMDGMEAKSGCTGIDILGAGDAEGGVD